MISFIVIGRNEGSKLTNCINSIYKTISNNNVTNFEVIYVDSNSNDDSIKRALNFTNLKVYKIIGHFNSAIARNIGAKESIGSTLFFIDGDMELIPDFLCKVYDISQQSLLYDFVSGNLINYYYNYSGTLLKKENLNEFPLNDKIEYSTGGVFLIKREIWFRVNGMKNKMKRSQDLDLGLRLAKINIPLVRKKDIIVIHHTISYIDNMRLWILFFSGANQYRIILLRENFFNIHEWKLFLRGNYTFLLMIFLLLNCYLFHNIQLFFIYFVIVGLRLIKKEKNINFSLLNQFINIILYEFLFIFTFLFYYPKNYSLSYIRIQNINGD